MDLKTNWPQIDRTFKAGIQTSLHCAIATVGPDGCPHVTPIGFVFLRDDFTAFYFDEYTKKMPQNLAQNPRVCLLTVNSSPWFWFRSLYQGKFNSPPGMRLLGTAGKRRPASDAEKAAYQKRVKPFRRLKGYQLIWRDLGHVRDIQLESVEPVLYPKMTDELWK